MAAPETARKRHASARASLRGTLLAPPSAEKRPKAIGLRAEAPMLYPLQVHSILGCLRW